MNNKLRLVAALICAASCTLPAFAQQKTTVAQDRDEPGRNPFQQSMQMTQNAGNCGPLLGLCALSFDVVPAGKRLVVTHASAILHTDPSTGNPLVYAGPAQIPNFSHTLPLPQARGGTRHVSAGPLLFYVEAGSYPYVIVQGSPLTDGASASASLSGYYVALP